MNISYNYKYFLFILFNTKNISFHMETSLKTKTQTKKIPPTTNNWKCSRPKKPIRSIDSRSHTSPYITYVQYYTKVSVRARRILTNNNTWPQFSSMWQTCRGTQRAGQMLKLNSAHVPGRPVLLVPARSSFRVLFGTCLFSVWQKGEMHFLEATMQRRIRFWWFILWILYWINDCIGSDRKMDDLKKCIEKNILLP